MVTASRRIASGRLAPGWSAICASQARKDFAGAGERRVDGIGWGLAPPPLQGRISDAFLLAVDHPMRLVNAIDFLLQQFRFHGGTPLVKERGRRESGKLNRREGGSIEHAGAALLLVCVTTPIMTPIREHAGRAL
jgi:hypothetical protein